MTESSVTFDEAMKLLQLPRELGTHPESGEPVVAGLGRFGPYVKHGDDFRSLETDEELFTADLDHALRLFSEPKRSRRRQAAKKVITSIARPEGAPLQVLEGRYGPYVTDGETNASVPRGTDPNTLTLEAANDLLEARRSAAPRAGRGRASGARKKKTATPVAKKTAKAASASKPKRTRKVAVPS